MTGTGDGGEITLDDNVKRIMLPESLDGYLVSLGDGWKEAFLQELASLPEVIEGRVCRLIVLEDSLLNDQMNLEEQATHWLNWTPSIPVYPGTNQLNHYHLEGVDTPRQFLRAVDLSLPRSFDCEGVFVNSEGQMALRRGPSGMQPHVLKTNVIAMPKLVGLLTSTKSYSLSKRAKEGEKAVKQAGYLEASKVVNAGAQGIPYERLRSAPSEMVARAQLVL